MSSKSSNDRQKQSTQSKSGASSLTSKNQKEEAPKNSGALNNPSERTPQRAYSSTSNAQTSPTYSQYQTICPSKLPSPHSWPNENTLPSREQMDYDLLGLSYQTPSFPPQYFAVALEQNTRCPYHGTSLGLASEASQVGRDLGVMDRWILEDESESGVMFAREGIGRMSTDNGYSCVLVEGFGDEMANWERS